MYTKLNSWDAECTWGIVPANVTNLELGNLWLANYYTELNYTNMSVSFATNNKNDLLQTISPNNPQPVRVPRMSKI